MVYALPNKSGHERRHECYTLPAHFFSNNIGLERPLFGVSPLKAPWTSRTDQMDDACYDRGTSNFRLKRSCLDEHAPARRESASLPLPSPMPHAHGEIRVKQKVGCKDRAWRQATRMIDTHSRALLKPIERPPGLGFHGRRGFCFTLSEES